MHLRKALITGITGQDGSYLAELLLARGYEVHGAVRALPEDSSAGHFQRISHILDRIQLHAVALENYAESLSMVRSIQPDECYHLSARSFVSYSFDDEFSTLTANINGTHGLVSALRMGAPKCRLCFAGSGEMFGRVVEVPQRETTPFRPRSVYGISKIAGFELVRGCRETHKMFACSAILFNHESPRRGPEFVTRKISMGVAAILAGRSGELALGSLEHQRDWGHARDYVEAMWMMLQQDTADDFVIATGVSRTVRQFVDAAFGVAGLRAEDFVRFDPAFERPAESYILRGDASKARERLGWRPSTSFEDLVREMVESDCRAAGVDLSVRRVPDAVRVHTTME